MANDLVIVEVPFHGDVIEAVQDEKGAVYVPVKPVSEKLGLSSNGQIEKLKEQEWARGKFILSRDTSGRLQECYALPLTKLPMWLARIQVKRVKVAYRPMLKLYQEEAADVLAAHFLGGGMKEAAAPQIDPHLAMLQSLVAMRQDQLRQDERLKVVEAKVTETQKSQTDTEQRIAKTQDIAAQASQRAMQAGCVAHIAFETAVGNHGYLTVLGYLKIHGREVEEKEASAHGKALTAICNQRGITVGKCRHQKYGYVNSYPESILDAYFGYNHKELPGNN